MSNKQAPSTQPSRHALLIGINSYPNFFGGNLAGCVSDVALVAQLLKERFLFLDADIEIITDETIEKPTRSHILTALERLVARTGTDDRVVLYYAGHGSRVRNPKRPSGYSETIVPCDSGRSPMPNRDILNDELRIYLQRLTDRTPHLTLIFDCCHSATLHRDRFGEGLRAVPADYRTVEHVSNLGQPPDAAPADSQWLSRIDRYVAFLACRDQEEANELRLSGAQKSAPSQTHGALTYHLVQELRRCSMEPSNRELFEIAARRVTVAFPNQHPVCEGALARTVIQGTATEPLRYALVSCVEENTVLLDVGLSHGAVIGSEWEIFPPGTQDFTMQALPRSVARIVSALAANSRAVLIADPVRVEPFSRAVETRRPVEFRLPVELVSVPGTDPDYAKKARILLERSGWLRLASAEPTAVRVYQLPPRSEASAELPVPQLATVDTECWAVVGQDGELWMQLIPVIRLRLLIDNLEKLARQRFLRNLSNPQSPLCGKIVWQVVTDGTPEDASTFAASTNPAQHAAGTRIELLVWNKHSRALFLNFLLLDAEGGVHILCPPTGGHLEIAAKWQGRLKEVEPPALPFPADHSSLLQRRSADPTSIRVHILLVVSNSPMDLTPLVQTKVRSRISSLFEGRETALGQMLRDVLSERVAGAVSAAASEQTVEWATELKEVIVFRKQSPSQ